MVCHIVSRRLQPFEQAFILEDHANVLSFDLSRCDPEVVDDPALLIIVQHAPLIGDHPFSGHQYIAVEERIVDASCPRLHRMEFRMVYLFHFLYEHSGQPWNMESAGEIITFAKKCIKRMYSLTG